MANFGKRPRLQAIEETGDDSTSRWQGVKSILRETIETVVLTLLIFFLIRAFIQNFRIEGASMEPNMHDGQYLMIPTVSLSNGSSGSLARTWRSNRGGFSSTAICWRSLIYPMLAHTLGVR